MSLDERFYLVMAELKHDMEEIEEQRRVFRESQALPCDMDFLRSLQTQFVCKYSPNLSWWERVKCALGYNR